MLKTHFPLSTQGLYFTTKLKDNIWLILKEYLSHLIRFSYCEIWKALADKVFVSRLGGSWRLQFPCKLLSRLNSTIILTTVPKKTIHWWKIKLFFRVFALFLVVVLTLLLFSPIYFPWAFLPKSPKRSVLDLQESTHCRDLFISPR